jgi:hypothetical protein
VYLGTSRDSRLPGTTSSSECGRCDMVMLARTFKESKCAEKTGTQ